MTTTIKGLVYPKSFMERFLSYAETCEEVTWTCATCGVIAGRPVTLQGMTRYGKASCACQDAERARERQAEQHRDWMRQQVNVTYGWLGREWEDMSMLSKTFDSFDAEKQPTAFEMVRAYILHLRGTLVLHGSYGTGKTHLLAALCNELRHAGRESLFTTAPTLFAAIQSCIAHDEDYTRLIRHATRTKLLVIDDIDKAKKSDFREEIYFNIVDERVKRGLPMAISTNRLSELASYVGGAVCSRLKVGQIDVPMDGVDYRDGLDG